MIWKEDDELNIMEEKVEYLESCPDNIRQKVLEIIKNTFEIPTGPIQQSITNETNFCDQLILDQMLNGKSTLGIVARKSAERKNWEKRHIANKRRVDPFDKTGCCGPFASRQAMKLANLDKVYDFAISDETDELKRKRKEFGNENRNNLLERSSDIFNFAEIGGAPGAFSEFILFRKGFYNAKGLAVKQMKEVSKFVFNRFSYKYVSPNYINSYCPENGEDVDITGNGNIESLEDYIKKNMDPSGLDLVISNVLKTEKNKENDHELVMKRFYLCQMLTSLCILKEGGTFVNVIFDIFTPFSAGLVYLMYCCFDQVSIHKPNVCRPANSERFLVCQGLQKEYSTPIMEYLKKVNKKFDELSKNEDILSCVPLDLMKEDLNFFYYLKEQNEKICKKQIVYLKKYIKYAENKEMVDKDKERLKDESLNYWELPSTVNLKESALEYIGIDEKTFFNPKKFTWTLPFLTKLYSSHMPDYMYTFKSERSRPLLLIRSKGGIEVLQDGSLQKAELLPTYRNVIPEYTILYAEICPNKVVSKNGVCRSAIRVIDAALLNGDNISKFPFLERQKAIQKFCKAVCQTSSYSKDGFSPLIFPAKFYKAEDRTEMIRRLKIKKSSHTKLCFITEHGYEFAAYNEVLLYRFLNKPPEKQIATYDNIFIKDQNKYSSFFTTSLVFLKQGHPMMHCTMELDFNAI